MRFFTMFSLRVDFLLFVTADQRPTACTIVHSLLLLSLPLSMSLSQSRYGNVISAWRS